MKVILLLIAIIYAVTLPVDSHGHGHAHGDVNEPAHFKYSKEANERYQDEEDDHDTHAHSHSHNAPPHSHSHGEPPSHSHSHIPPASHSHSHDPAASHSHSHDPPASHSHSHDPPASHSHSHDPPASHSHSHDAPSHSHSHDAPPHSHSHDAPPHSHSHASSESVKEGSGSKKAKEIPNDYSMWLYAVTATGLISAAPVIILWFIPLDNTNKHQSLLKILLSFASGGLLGDAFLHLIPHAIDPHDHSSEHSHSHSHSEGHSHDHTKNMMVGLWVVAGIIIFLCVEKLVRFVKGGHGHTHSIGEHSHSSKEVKIENKGGKGKKGDGDKKKVQPVEHTDIKVSGYLNLAADFAHNFTDGLAIGASFLVGNNVGIVTTVTILFHEIPHEIGDFAILIQSGCSKRRAMLLQLTTAVGAMLGTLCSLMAQGAGQAATTWILPFTAGGFIYIATVSVIPELLEDSKPGQSFKEICAMLFGIGMMIFIALYE